MPRFSPSDVAAAIFLAMQRLFKLDNVTHMASVEFWVVMTTLLLVFRFLMDFRPWYSDRFMVATVQIIEMLNYSMVHYTMGLMQLSAARVNDYFQVWAVLLVTLQYSVKIGRPYSRSKRKPLLDLMSSFWSANLLRVHTFFPLRIPLWLIWSLNAARIISYFSFSDKAANINEENTRLVSDYMRYEHELGPDSQEFSMQRYKYLVLGEDEVLKKVQQERRTLSAQERRTASAQERRTASAQYRIRLDPDHKKLITVEKIWKVGADGSGLLGNTADADNRLKDVCLSFALYKLLRRRFYDLPIHEAGQEKTRRLVFEYVLQEDTKSNNYERAFRVTEVELSLLQDLFYSKHAAMFADGFPFRSMVLSLSLAAATGYIAYPVRSIPERMDPADLNRITHGVLITRLIVALIVGKELLEIFMYVFSQWTKVRMICMHAKHQCLRHPLVEAAMRMMFCLITRGKWDQKIFQYNLLISSTGLRLTCLCFSFNIPFRHKSPKSIKLEPQVKAAIFESFKGLQQHPERLESYSSNAFGLNKHHMHQFTWAIKLEADTHRILVWHIATCLCEIHLSDEATALNIVWLRNRLLVNKSRAPKDVWPHYLTAASLSNYCAYLLTKALVPDKGLVANKVLNEVRSETFHATTNSSRFQSLQDVYEKLMKKPDKESEEVAIGEPEEVPAGYGTADISTINEEEPKGEDAVDEEELKGEDAIDEDKETEEVAIGEPEEVPAGYRAADSSTINEEEPKGEDAIDEEEPEGEDAIDWEEPEEVPAGYGAAESSTINEEEPEGEDAIDEEEPEGEDAIDEEEPEGEDAIDWEEPEGEDAIDEEEPEEVPAGYGAADSSTINEEEPKGEDAIGEEELKGKVEIDRFIIQLGAKLGKQLIETYATDRVGLWRDLAEFWTGFLLHLAASTSAAKHRRQLVGNGELITHLWALLSHAGFLGRTRHDFVDNDS